MTINKYSLFPIQRPKLWASFKMQEHAFWTAEEIDLSQDLTDWHERLTDNERFYIKHILAFFAQSDGIVNENLAVRFYNDIDFPEAKAFYSAQMFIETIHAEVYGLLIETYVQDYAEKNKLFDAINNIPTIAKKANWALKWINSQESLAKRLVAFAVVEGIFFSGAFCSIFWLRKRGLMPGLSMANTLISRDEGLHWVFATQIFEEMGLSLTHEEFSEVVIEAVTLEKEFIRDALPVSLIGMNADLMSQYIEYTADRVAERFNMGKIYKTTNPFDFMNLIDLESKQNFFEKRSTEYKKTSNRSLGFDAAF